MQIKQKSWNTVHALRVRLSAGVFLWECESPKVGTGQPSHPCSVFLPVGKIGRSGEAANKMLHGKHTKTDMGGWGENASAGGVRCCGNRVLRQTAQSRFNTQMHKVSKHVHVHSIHRLSKSAKMGVAQCKLWNKAQMERKVWHFAIIPKKTSLSHGHRQALGTSKWNDWEIEELVDEWEKEGMNGKPWQN